MNDEDVVVSCTNRKFSSPVFRQMHFNRSVMMRDKNLFLFFTVPFQDRQNQHTRASFIWAGFVGWIGNEVSKN